MPSYSGTGYAWSFGYSGEGGDAMIISASVDNPGSSFTAQWSNDDKYGYWSDEGYFIGYNAVQNELNESDATWAEVGISSGAGSAFQEMWH